MKSDLCLEWNNPVIVRNVLLMATKYIEAGMLLIVVPYVLLHGSECVIKTFVSCMNKRFHRGKIELL